MIAGCLDAGTGVEPAQVHRGQLLDSQAVKVGLDPSTQLLWPLSGNQILLVVVLGADLTHQHQMVRVRM